jgi:very-short-patch-repair endonuclease
VSIEQLHRYGNLLDEGWTRQNLRSGMLRQEVAHPTRGVYGPPGTTPDDVRSLLVRLPPGSVLGFHSAAAAYGLPVPPDRRLHVIIPPDADLPLIRGVAAHASVLPVRDPVWNDGVPCVPAVRCAVDLARLLGRAAALALLDATLRAALCTAEQLAAEVALHAGLRGVRQARELVRRADPRPECVQESHLRLVLLDGRLPPPEPQLWVANLYGTVVYRVDLGYEQQRVGVEYDGRSHLDSVERDRFRHNWLVENGWRMRYFTARDLYQDPGAIVASVKALLAA